MRQLIKYLFAIGQWTDDDVDARIKELSGL